MLSAALIKRHALCDDDLADLVRREDPVGVIEDGRLCRWDRHANHSGPLFDVQRVGEGTEESALAFDELHVPAAPDHVVQPEGDGETRR